MKEISISIFFAIVSVFLVNSSFAENDAHWWNKNETASLSVEKDFKLSRTGRNYYVDGKKGSDKGDGSSTYPWKTISKAFDHYSGRPGPGDAIIIKAGVYKESLSIRARGNPENRILIGPYGDGEVIIDASPKFEEWVFYKDKIYNAKCEFKPAAVVVDEKPLFPEFFLEKVNKGKWFYDDKNKVIYVYIPDGANPSTHDVGVIKDDEFQDGIMLQGAQYLTFYGLTLKYAGGHGFSVLGDYNTIEKCNIKFNGKAAVAIWPYGDTKSIGCAVIKSHIYHNMIRNWPRGHYKEGNWAASIGGGVSETRIIGNVVHKNGGEGILLGRQGGIIRDNIVYDNWSVNIYACGIVNSVIEGNRVFCHEQDPSELYNNGDNNPNDNKNFRRLRAEGIMTADEGSPAILHNVKIINNIIINCRRGITHYGLKAGSGMKQVLVANNTIIVPDAKGVGEDYIGIKVPYNNGNNVDTVFKNNIIYASNPRTNLLVMSDQPFSGEQFKGVTFDHNIWYHATRNNPFRLGHTHWGLYDTDFKGWEAQCGSHCSQNRLIDPKIKNVKGYSKDDMELMLNSPAKGCGAQEGI